MNGLAEAQRWNDTTVAEASRSLPSRFTPAPYVFSIWGLIYLLVACFAVAQLLPDRGGRATRARVTAPFLLSSLGNITWIWAQHHRVLWLTQVAILVMLGSLIACYRAARPTPSDGPGPLRLLTWCAFSIYLGWLTVATLANTLAVFVGSGAPQVGMSGPVVAFCMVLGLAIMCLLGLRERDVLVPAVATWAFAGIARVQPPDGGAVTAVAIGCSVVAGVVAITGVPRFVRVARSGR